VLLKNGKTKAIKDIAVGDRVAGPGSESRLGVGGVRAGP
jgi:hypothetical protein